MLPVAILAGGLATRIRPITESIPKALIEVANKPFIEHQLEYLQLQGITSIVICIGYLGEMIQEAVGDGSRWKMKITYSPDGNTLLGTGGALKKALHLLGDQFFVLYGDSYLPIDFSTVQSAYSKSNQLGLMTVLKNKNQWDRSNVQFENGQLIKYDKLKTSPQMQHIDYGLGIIQAKTLLNYPNNKAFDLANVYNDLSLKNELAGFEVFKRFYEIGSLQGIADTEGYLLKQLKEI